MYPFLTVLHLQYTCTYMYIEPKNNPNIQILSIDSACQGRSRCKGEQCV